MKTLRSPLPLLPLVLLWAVCSVSQVQAEIKAVKLCGREFIRALVYTCGGSRWRRLLTPQNMEEFYNGVQNSAEDASESEGLNLIKQDPRIKRDPNFLMTEVCCQVGCRKRDLTFLC